MAKKNVENFSMSRLRRWREEFFFVGVSNQQRSPQVGNGGDDILKKVSHYVLTFDIPINKYSSLLVYISIIKPNAH